jgi:hypothetical protein
LKVQHERMTHTTVQITDPTPIACSLPGAEYRERVAEIGQVARDALRDRRTIDGGARLSFDDTVDVRERLEALVAAESLCCPFLRIKLHAAGGELVLEVTGPEEAAPMIEELFA